MLPSKPAEYTATLQAIRPLTRDVSEIVLEVQGTEPFRHLAGQFINVYIPREESKPLIRSYSIASSPLGNGRELIISIDTDVHGGPGVGYMTGLKPGDSIRFKGPLGIFRLKEPSDRPVLIVTHISALGMCRHLAEAALIEAPDRPVTLLFETKHEGDLFYHQALLELYRRFPSFQYVITCPGASAAWTGPRRTLLEEAVRRLPDPPSVDVYVCGLGPMVATLKDGLKEAGVAPERIVAEKWSKAEAGAGEAD